MQCIYLVRWGATERSSCEYDSLHPFSLIKPQKKVGFIALLQKLHQPPTKFLVRVCFHATFPRVLAPPMDFVTLQKHKTFSQVTLAIQVSQISTWCSLEHFEDRLHHYVLNFRVSELWDRLKVVPIAKVECRRQYSASKLLSMMSSLRRIIFALHPIVEVPRSVAPTSLASTKFDDFSLNPKSTGESVIAARSNPR